MTGSEIITLARSHFGEPTASSVTAVTALEFLNEALRQVYSDLPASRLKELISTSTVTLSSGRGAIGSTWDKVIEVYLTDKPAIQVTKETIFNTEISTYFVPGAPIFYVDEQYVWVRPTGISSADVVYLQPPSTILTAGLGSEITEIHSAYHEATANLIASYMYAQEEDVTQAQHYKAEYTSKLSNTSEILAAEAGG